MAYGARIILDSISPNNVRLTTMEVTIPRIVLAEFNTHRMFARNSASSRAIPVEKMLKKVQDDPFIPIYWGKNQKGMQADQELTLEEQANAMLDWLQAKDDAIRQVNRLLIGGVHKQIANRLLEPFLWHTILVTATEWENFFNLRRDKHAQPEIRKGAEMMWDVMQASTPKELKQGEWHLPLLQPNEFVLPKDSPEWNEPMGFEAHLMDIEMAKKISTGRCARVSYLTHDGKRDYKADISLCEGLVKNGHMSPFEHVARPMCEVEIRTYQMFHFTLENGRQYNMREAVEVGDRFDGMRVIEVKTSSFLGNFNGWVQYRKELPNEAVFQNPTLR